MKREHAVMGVLLVAVALGAYAMGRRAGEAEPGGEVVDLSPPRRAAPAAAEEDEEDAEEAAAPVLVRSARPIMSTTYQISVETDRRQEAEEAIEAALDEVERLGVVLSEWRPDSEVSAINRAAGRDAVRVGEDTMANVTSALDVARWTDGAFDISWAAIREFYLFQEGASAPDLDAVRARLPLVNYRDVIVDEEASTVRLAREGMSLGLGGIAKGYAVDRAAALLEARGFSNFMIFGGGQVLVRGLREGRRWRVGIQHPRAADRYIGFLEVTDCSVATSGDYEHSFVDEDGERWHHIIDLRTGLPARHTTSVTIVAPSGLLADGFDTGCFVMGAEACLARIAELQASGELAGLEAVILDGDLRLFTTPGTRDRLTLRMPITDDGRIPAEE